MTERELRKKRVEREKVFCDGGGKEDSGGREVAAGKKETKDLIF